MNIGIYYRAIFKPNTNLGKHSIVERIRIVSIYLKLIKLAKSTPTTKT